MNKFKQLKMIYSQFFNLAEEIKEMIKNEEYNEAISKLQYKQTLIEKLALTKKNIALNDEEKLEILEIEEKFKEVEKNNLETLKGQQSKVAIELTKVKNNLKLTGAYSKKTSEHSGSMLDLSE